MPYPFKGPPEVCKDVVEIQRMLQVFLAEDPETEYLFCGVPSGSETCLLVIVTLWGRGKPHKNRHPSSKSRVSLCIVVTADAIGCQTIANKL